MSLPKVTIAFATGNLLLDVAAPDGIAGMVINGVATGACPLNTPKVIYNMDDLKALGINNTIVGTAAANTTIAVNTIGSDGVVSTWKINDVTIAVYTKVTGDSTPTLIATAIRALINAGTGTHGFTASGSAANIIITDLLANGAKNNGVDVLITGSGASIFSTGQLSGGVGDAPNDVAYRHIKEFYDQVGGNQELHIMLVVNTVTMASMLDNSNVTNGARKLLTAGRGRIRLLGLCRKPASGYAPGSDFIDSDVSAALTAANTFGAARLAELAPVRILIEGRVATEASSTILSPSTLESPYAAVVLGGTKNDSSASVGLALGRAVRYAAHIKVGKVANGPLAMTAAYIGTKEIKDMTNLATLHGLGYISFMIHPQKGGFYFGVDRTATIGDCRLLAYGRIVDKAAVIASAVLINELEGEIDLDTTGSILEEDAVHLEGKILQQLQNGMAEQVSAFAVTIPRDQDIVNTSTLNVKLRVQPKGYSTFINVEIGLTASL